MKILLLICSGLLFIGLMDLPIGYYMNLNKCLHQIDKEPHIPGIGRWHNGDRIIHADCFKQD